MAYVIQKHINALKIDKNKLKITVKKPHFISLNLMFFVVRCHLNSYLRKADFVLYLIAYNSKNNYNNSVDKRLLIFVKHRKDKAFRLDSIIPAESQNGPSGITRKPPPRWLFSLYTIKFLDFTDSLTFVFLD